MILGKATYTFTRPTAPSWVDGQPVYGEPETFTVRGSLQPASSQDLEQLEAGARSSARWILLCRGRSRALELGDLVEVKGRTHRVLSLQDWSEHTRGVPYRGYILEEVGA